MTVEEQRASARRFAEANFTKTVKKTSEKKISKRRAKDVQEEEEEEVPKSLTKLQEAKLKQRELLAQRAKEKAEQIRSAKRRPSMAGKKRRQTKLMSEEGVDSDSELEVDEVEEEEEVVAKDTGGMHAAYCFGI